MKRKLIVTTVNEAKGKNPNPFFFIAETPTPLISKKANITLPNLIPTFLYDIKTQAGKSYTFVNNK